MGIWEEMQFGRATEAGVGPSGCEGPRGRPRRGVPDIVEPQVWGKEERLGLRRRKPPVGLGEKHGKTAKGRDHKGPAFPNRKTVTLGSSQ